MNLTLVRSRVVVSVRYGAFFAESASAMSIAVTFSPMPLLDIASSNMIRQ